MHEEEIKTAPLFPNTFYSSLPWVFLTPSLKPQFEGRLAPAIWQCLHIPSTHQIEVWHSKGHTKGKEVCMWVLVKAMSTMSSEGKLITSQTSVELSSGYEVSF